MGDFVGDNVCGHLYFFGAGERLDCVCTGVLVFGIHRHFIRMRISGVKEMVVGGREDIVEILLFEKGFLGLEAFVAKEGCQDGVSVDRLVGKALAEPFLEGEQVGIEKTEAKPVAGESPVAFAGYGFFKL